MASNKMFRTTVQLPLGGETGECSIQVPMSVFESEADEDSRDELIAEFTSKITASFSKISREVLRARKPVKREAPGEKEAQPNSPVKRHRRNEDSVTIASMPAKTRSMMELDPDRDDNTMITIEFRYSGNFTSYRIRMKRTTPLLRAFEELAEANGRSLATMRMFYDTECVRGYETPESVSRFGATNLSPVNHSS